MQPRSSGTGQWYRSSQVWEDHRLSRSWHKLPCRWSRRSSNPALRRTAATQAGQPACALPQCRAEQPSRARLRRCSSPARRSATVACRSAAAPVPERLVTVGRSLLLRCSGQPVELASASQLLAQQTVSPLAAARGVASDTPRPPRVTFCPRHSHSSPLTATQAVARARRGRASLAAAAASRGSSSSLGRNGAPTGSVRASAALVCAPGSSAAARVATARPGVRLGDQLSCAFSPQRG